MAIDLVCTHCNKVTATTSKQVISQKMGKKVKCKLCGNALFIEKANIKVHNPERPKIKRDVPEKPKDLYYGISEYDGEAGKYVQNSLSNDEFVVYLAKVSVWTLAPLILVGIILLPVYVGVLFFLWAFIIYKTTELAITNKKIIAKFGFIKRETIEIKVDRVESVQVNQGVIGRLLNYGTIIVSGAGNPQAPITKISNPLSFRAAFFDLQEQLAKICGINAFRDQAGLLPIPCI